MFQKYYMRILFEISDNSYKKNNTNIKNIKNINEYEYNFYDGTQKKGIF